MDSGVIWAVAEGEPAFLGKGPQQGETKVVGETQLWGEVPKQEDVRHSRGPTHAHGAEPSPNPHHLPRRERRSETHQLRVPP